MKRLLLLTAAAVIWALPLAKSTHAAPSLIWQSTFNCNEWDQSMGNSESVVCLSGDGIAGWGTWVTALHPQGSQITLAANNPIGGGSRGFRLWRCDGQNCNTSSIRITIPTAQTELWIRWYMRYQLGFTWTNNSVGYTKEILMFGNSATDWTTGFVSSDSFRMEIYSGAQVLLGPSGWATINSGTVGDGRFHCYEVHVKMDTNHANGLLDMWLDDRSILSRTDVNWGSVGTWQTFLLGENANNPSNGTDMYVDYDDIAVSASGYIGPLGRPSAPTNLRIVR